MSREHAPLTARQRDGRSSVLTAALSAVHHEAQRSCDSSVVREGQPAPPVPSFGSVGARSERRDGVYSEH